MFEQLADRRASYRQTLRRTEIQSRLKSIREQNMAEEDNAELFSSLPGSIPQIYEMFLNSDPGAAFKTCIAKHTKDLEPYILPSTFEVWKALCFIFTDLMVSVELGLAQEVAARTFTAVLTKAVEYLAQFAGMRMTMDMALFRYALVAVEVRGLDRIDDKEYEVLCQILRDRLEIFDQTTDSLEAIYEPLGILNYILEQPPTPAPSTLNHRVATCVSVCFPEPVVRKLLKLTMDSSSLDDCETLCVSLMQLLVNLTHQLESPAHISHILLYCVLNVHLNSQSPLMNSLAVKLFHNVLMFKREGELLGEITKTAQSFGLVGILLRLLTPQHQKTTPVFELCCDTLDTLARYILCIPLEAFDLLESFVSADGVEIFLYNLSERGVLEFQPDTVLLVLFALRKILLGVVDHTRRRVAAVFTDYLLKAQEGHN